MAVTTADLKRIQAAAGQALARELLEHNLSPQDAQKIGEEVLVAIADAVDASDPNPWPRGGTVILTGRQHPQGTIVRTAAQFGEVHTVTVRWNGTGAEEFHSPAELELIR